MYVYLLLKISILKSVLKAKIDAATGGSQFDFRSVHVANDDSVDRDMIESLYNDTECVVYMIEEYIPHPVVLSEDRSKTRFLF